MFRIYIYFTILYVSCIQQILCPIPPRKLAKCKYDIELLWSKEVGHAAFASSPLIADINADGLLDIVAVPFTDVLTVLSGQDGHVLPSSQWPQQLMDMSVHSSPLLYDIDRDGLDDILMVTSDGEIMFYKYDGQLLLSAKIPKALLKRDWYEHWISHEQTSIEEFIYKTKHIDDTVPADYIAVDSHVLATPVLADLNGDNILEELLIPVSYYFDLEQYSHNVSLEVSNLTVSDLDHYLLSSVVIFNLTSLQITHSYYLDLTQTDEEYPGYIVSSPTVVDLDSNASTPEILVATLAGTLHAFTAAGNRFPGFPLYNTGQQAQVTVADVDLDGQLDILVMNGNGSLQCLTTHGRETWAAQLSGPSTSGCRVADINGDGAMEVVLATTDGNVWAVHGDNGSVLMGWPYRVTQQMTALPLVTRLEAHPHLDVVIMSDNHHLHIIRGDTKCRHAFMIGEMSYVSPLAHDLVPMAPGMEVLVATKDGTLLCLGRKPRLDLQHDLRYRSLEGMSGELKTHNAFTHHDGQVGVYIHRDKDIIDVTGSWMTLTFDILDLPEKQLKIPRAYKVAVYVGSDLRAVGQYSVPGTYALHVAAPDAPSRAHLTITLTNRHAQVFQDRVAVRFNMLFLHDLQWLLLCPFIAMAIILLFLHGYPAADLLPMARSKNV